MSVRIADGAIVLEGRCPAQDAEDLLRALQEMPGAPVDIARVQKLHMAVLQVLAAARPSVRGQPPTGTLSHEIFRRLISDNGSISDSDRTADFS